jgi:hypothetical protein
MLAILRAAAFGVLVLGNGAAAAHGGGLNAEGCHNDRKNGGYHCHRSSKPRTNPDPPPRAGQPASRNAFSADDRVPTAYRNCAAARAAGAAPVRRGDAGYGSHLDRDGDGVGCE